MCLKHKGGVNHSAVARRHKSQSHTHRMCSPAYSLRILQHKRQQLRITLPRSYSHAGRERGCFSKRRASAASKRRLQQLFTGASRRNTNKQTPFTWPGVFTLQSTQSALRGAKGPWRVPWLQVEGSVLTSAIAAERSQHPAVYISCGESLPFALKCYIGFPPVLLGAVKWARCLL